MTDGKNKRPEEHTDEDVDEALEESFPASDPPAYTGTTAGDGDKDEEE